MMIDTIHAKKLNTTQTWDETGKRLPVTVLSVPTAKVVEVKDPDKHGYSALRLAFNPTKPKRVTKPLQGVMRSVKLDEVYQTLKEVRLKPEAQVEVKPGEDFDMLSAVEVGDRVNVAGKSRGKGFTGVMKRWGFAGGPRTHGQSDRERAPGSIGQGTDPGRVWKGKKMAGRSGGVKVNQLGLQVIKVDSESRQIWVAGTTPGHKNALVSLTLVGKAKKPIKLKPEVSETDNTQNDKQQSEQ